MTEISIDLKDVLGSDSVVHHAEIVANPAGISVTLFRHGENVSIGTIQIENHQGNLDIHVWTNAEEDGDPSYYHNFSEDNPGFCMQCGESWIVHENGCVDDGA